tara:strand:+ start:1047 stop:1553 length:507 start_codon:yes stop_codon:yes gene_type:complete
MTIFLNGKVMNNLEENGRVIGNRFVTGSMVSSWNEFLFLKKIKKNSFELSIRRYEIVNVDDCEVIEIVTSDTKDKYGEYEIKVPKYYNGRKIKDYDGDFLYYDNLVKCFEYDDESSPNYKVDCSINFDINNIEDARVWFEKTKKHCDDPWDIDFKMIENSVSNYEDRL